MAIDWSKSMKQTFEFYEVDPITWTDVAPITNVTKATIKRDSSKETLGSASFSTIGPIGEKYIRTYLVATQGNETVREELGVHLVQTPKDSFNGLVHSFNADGYTPLIELKEKGPDLGYTIMKNQNVLSIAYQLIRENMRGPVVQTEYDKTLFSNFTSNTSDTWLSFINDLVSSADNYSLAFDEQSRVIFMPYKETAALAPVITFDESNSSILYPNITIEKDLYDVPNVLRVIYSKNNGHFIGEARNEDEDSETSIANRGREIIKMETDPELSGSVSKNYIQQYAERRLKALSTVEYRIAYSHGYNPRVRLGDCVLLNCPTVGLTNIKARVVSQSIDCTPGCKVEEEAVFTKKLWG